MTFPINLQSEITLYFSWSFLGIVLKPAIKKEPFPKEKMIPNKMKNATKIISIITFILLSQQSCLAYTFIDT